ncbi:MAG TPA: hypothetical protein VFN55_18955 [Solirubrobacteraceae bacterium]|nr:hypothetical protein [Solirubrobacteraceae bacterium]
MDAFAIVIFGGIVALVLWVWILGRYFPGSGMEQLGMKSAREIVETREELEAEDLQQMLAAHNERRRRRGKAEVSVDDIELQVASDLREVRARREAYLADRELDELLEATNARRRARGETERTRDDVRREFGAPDAPASSGPADRPGSADPS